MKVVILAGGFGSRISEESHLKPKPMIEIGDAPILWHIMKQYSHFGHNEFIICCGYKGHLIKEYFANYYLHRSDITFDFANGNNMIAHNNVAEPWKVTLVDTGLYTQTGGRIRRIHPYTGDDAFLMTYGDGVSNVDINAVICNHKATKKVVTLTSVQPHGRFGVLDLDQNDNIIGFREKSKQDTGWINAGFMVVEPDIFQYLEDDDAVLETRPFEILSERGELGAYKHYGFWQCMDTQRDKQLLEQYWENGNAPWVLD